MASKVRADRVGGGHVPHGIEPTADRIALRVLRGAAVVLLATALCVRPLLADSWTVSVPELQSPTGSGWGVSPLVMHVAHLLGAAGIVAGAAWIALSRRRWRFNGLEAGALLMVLAAMLSIPGASDKRLGINTAVGTILPLLAASLLHQLLASASMWRRALLAALVAAAAANCWKASAQESWELDQVWQDYLRDKTQFWARQGKDPSGWEAIAHEASMKAHQPTGYFGHPNVLASFLLLGLAGTMAAAAQSVAAVRSRASRRWALFLPVGVGAALAIWHLVVLRWIGSAGAAVGLTAGVAGGLLAWRLRDRPKRLAAIVVAAVGSLQAALMLLALNASEVYSALQAHGGKILSLAVRLNYWQGAIRLFGEHPLTGVGPGQFYKHYLTIKPAYATEGPWHAHNWLLNQAAEWGVLGLLGLLVALCVPVWAILRSSPGRTDEPGGAVAARFVPGTLVVAACWLLARPDAAMSYAIVASLTAVAFVSLSRPCGRNGLTILFAGLLAFFVCETVGMGAGVPGAVWPFWATVALALAWGSAPADSSERPGRGRLAQTLAIAVAVIAVAMAALTVRPLWAVVRMGNAQAALAAGNPDRAVRLLEAAAAMDTLDPAPLKAAGLTCGQMARPGAPQAAEHLARARRLLEAALQRDPLALMVWRNLAMVDMALARRVEDFGFVREALGAMHRALALFPNWPQGWFELAQMAGSEPHPQAEGPALMRIALGALEKAQALDEAWPADDPQKFSPAQRAALAEMRQRFLSRLDSGATPTSTTQGSSP